MERKPIEGCSGGLQVESGIVIDSVNAEGVVKGEGIESGAEIEAVRYRGGEFDARACC